MRPAADEQSSGPLNFGLGIADLISFTLRSPYIQIVACGVRTTSADLLTIEDLTARIIRAVQEAPHHADVSDRLRGRRTRVATFSMPVI